FFPLAAQAQGTVTFGGDAQAQTGAEPRADARAGSQTSGSAERELLEEQVPPESDSAREWAERDRKLDEANTLTGGVGLLHTQHAQGGALGQFRVGFATEYFSAGFLCSSEFPCPNPRDPSQSIRSDSTDHFGGRLRLSMQVLK